jgi:hypothetical protein
MRRLTRRRNRHRRYLKKNTRRQRGGARAISLDDWLDIVKRDRASRTDYTLRNLIGSEFELPPQRTLNHISSERSEEFELEAFYPADIRQIAETVTVGLSQILDIDLDMSPEQVRSAMEAKSADPDAVETIQYLKKVEESLSKRAGTDVSTYPSYIWYLYANTPYDKAIKELVPSLFMRSPSVQVE